MVNPPKIDDSSSPIGSVIAIFQGDLSGFCDTEALKAKGLVKKTLDGVKVLGNGELTKALTVKAAAYSASAKEKIEKAGGKAEVM